VKRSRAQIHTFSRDLRAFFSKADEEGSTDDESTCSTPSHLESSLNRLITESATLIEEPWNCQVLMVFMDNEPMPSCLTSPIFLLMKNKVKILDFFALQYPAYRPVHFYF
jgi:hypothetical protein